MEGGLAERGHWEDELDRDVLYELSVSTRTYSGHSFHPTPPHPPQKVLGDLFFGPLMA